MRPHEQTDKPKVWTRLPGTFSLESGATLEEVVIPWEHWGSPELPKVLLMPSFSHGSHARSSTADPTPGWWEAMIGPGLFIDTNKFHVICPSFLGSPYDGTTSPLTPAPGKDYPRGRDFPQTTPGDLARCHARLVEVLGIEKLHAVVGGSFGGKPPVATPLGAVRELHRRDGQLSMRFSRDF